MIIPDVLYQNKLFKQILIVQHSIILLQTDCLLQKLEFSCYWVSLIIKNITVIYPELHVTTSFVIYDCSLVTYDCHKIDLQAV